MAFSMRENPRLLNCLDSDIPALSTCSNADTFCRMNTMLGNSLDLSGVCTTPTAKCKRDPFNDRPDSDLSAVRSRMLFPSGGQDSSRGLPDISNWGLGLQSLSLSDWERPWSSHDTDPCTQNNMASLQGILGTPSQLSNKLPSYSNESSIGATDFLEKFPGMARLNSQSFLDSHSISPVDSETSGFSSGSDHLSDLLSSLRISPSVPFLMSSMQRDPLKLALGSRFDHRSSSLTPPPPSATPTDGLSHRWPGASIWPNWDLLKTPESPFSIEREAWLHRQAASINEATFTWSGQLPPRHYQTPIYSCKVFLGGVPWDITEAGLINTFKCYGPLSVEWPGKDGKHPRCPPKGNMPKGYVYLVFEAEKSVRALLQDCTEDLLHPEGYSEYYFKMSSRRMRCKDAQVIPWVISDSNFVSCPSQRLDPRNTVFVGALHGMLNAEALASIMNDLFGGVVYAGIDTDKHKYPIGSGRVTFNNQRSYLKAVSAAFIEIKTPKFTKKVQIDPYLEDAICQSCSREPGPFFCRDKTCFKYYCRSCWHRQHSMDILSNHRPLMRNQKKRDSN
ncbi:cytoplasmic polyadenylation element-binding protein 1 isoform X1 [Xyrauchen texanus]|uniref:cytoplasmic polyadenylation element-binding protein 1 isoform X1 n=1 Tax=Xyrauchen texanus TaxID=154827 RepID=UPI00224239FE|nr:cytoplasmic polyadenylation element-binding protein 1 isoform X1 [Xyrauchen texanus]